MITLVIFTGAFVLHAAGATSAVQKRDWPKAVMPALGAIFFAILVGAQWGRLG